MIQLGNKCYIDVAFDGFDKLTPSIFKKLIVKEESGLILPVFELHLKQLTYKLLAKLREVNTKIKITYGTSNENAVEYDFIILNYNYTTADNEMILILTGMIDIPDFTNTPRIRSFKSTSNSALSNIDSVNKVIINYSGSDDQAWIQHNNSDKNFVERVIAHAYAEKDDFITAGLSVDKELIITSVKKKFTENPVVTFTNSSKGSGIKYESLKSESDSALWSGLLSEGRSLPIIKVLERKMEKLDSNINSMVNDKSTSKLSSNINFPIVIDNGNCHKEYYKSWINNLTHSVQLNRNIIYLTVSNNYLDNTKLKLNDLVELMLEDETKNELADPMSGKYIVGEKITVIQGTGFSHRLKLYRDFNIE